MKVAFVTASRLGGLADDDVPLAAELTARGARVEPAVWSDPRVDWSQYSAIVLRSVWDYHERPEGFRDWLRRVADRPVWNPAALAEWNVHKRYLNELAARGVAIVPMQIVSAGTPCKLEALLADRGWPDAVIKPAVAATAYRTWRSHAASAAADQSRFDASLRGGDVIVQPFVEEIVEHGELSFVFIGGECSHVVRKRARTGEYRVQSEFGGRAERIAADPALLDQARAVAAAIPSPWLYARVDAVEARQGLLLMELELIEPELFVRLAPESAARFAGALLAVI